MSQYFPSNPDEVAEGCIVTGLNEPGVVFPEIEPIGYMHTYIGRTAIIEAASQCLGVTVDQVNAIPEQVSRIKNLTARLAQAETARDRYHDIVFGLTDALAEALPEQFAPGTNELDVPDKPKAKPARKTARKTAATADLE